MAKDKKTCYYGEDSRHSHKNSVRIQGEPITHGTGKKASREEWREKIVKQISQRIEDGKLKRIPPGMCCNLYITFSILQNRPVKKDIDNLLKTVFDALKEEEGGAGLIDDDVRFRGIKAEKNPVDDESKEGVDIKYFLTREFKITYVTPLDVNALQNEYRSYWNNKMNLITAYEIVDGEESEKECRFIDNAPGNVFYGDRSERVLRDAIPGYNWKARKTVEGCMVFHKTHQRLADDIEKDRDKKFWWINKWW